MQTPSLIVDTNVVHLSFRIPLKRGVFFLNTIQVQRNMYFTGIILSDVKWKCSLRRYRSYRRLITCRINFFMRSNIDVQSKACFRYFYGLSDFITGTHLALSYIHVPKVRQSEATFTQIQQTKSQIVEFYFPSSKPVEWTNAYYVRWVVIWKTNTRM